MIFAWKKPMQHPGLPTGGSNWRLRVGRWMHPRPGLMILTDFSEPKQAQRSGLPAYWFITTKDWPQRNPYQWCFDRCMHTLEALHVIQHLPSHEGCCTFSWTFLNNYTLMIVWKIGTLCDPVSRNVCNIKKQILFQESGGPWCELTPLLRWGTIVCPWITSKTHLIPPSRLEGNRSFRRFPVVTSDICGIWSIETTVESI